MDIKNQISNITIIGSGNVATAFGLSFHNIGININEIYSPNIENATILARKTNSYPIDDLTIINPNSELYLIAITDTEIENASNSLNKLNGILAHTSGSQHLNVLNNNHVGIFYPLQTFTKSKIPDFRDIPICIEGSDSNTINLLTKLANKISNKVFYLDSVQRQYLHLTAVTVNNFTNLLYDFAHGILEDKDIDFSLLLPLIKETAIKIQDTVPKDAQTGPARRNDISIIEKHIKLLEEYPDYKDIYSILSKHIIKKHHDKL